MFGLRSRRTNVGLREADSLPVNGYRLGTFRGNLDIMQRRCQNDLANKSCGIACKSDPNACPIQQIRTAMIELAHKNLPYHIVYEPDGKVKVAVCKGGGSEPIEFEQDTSSGRDGFMRIPGDERLFVARVICNVTSYV